jgi:hypothetical protein
MATDSVQKRRFGAEPTPITSIHVSAVIDGKAAAYGKDRSWIGEIL